MSGRRWVPGVIPSTGDPRRDAAVDMLVEATARSPHLRDLIRREVSQQLHGRPPVWERPSQRISGAA